jgi:apolipoprotein N-acyltransferase
MGLMLFAALLRVLIEVMCAALHAVKPSDAIDTRAALEWVGRLLFYVGVPAWLALRLSSG